VTEGYSTWLPDGAPQSRANGETAVPAERKYVGISATLYANGEAVAVNRYDTATFTGGTVYLGKDALGSVRGATNDYGLLEERYEYDAFGKPYKGDLNGGMNLGYTGKPYDTATGMYNYGYRDYQPEVARFSTVDPIRDGSNWFAYVNNDPVNWRDPWGLSPNEPKNNTTGGLPYEPEKWNDGGVIQLTTNCYAYALDLQKNPITGENFVERGPSGFALQPGQLAGERLTTLDPSTIVQNAKQDAVASGRTFEESGKDTLVEHGNWKVALVIAPDIDYHWYRQNDDGTWSHKPGSTPVTNVDNSGNVITNPENADRGIYTDFIGYYEVGR
jgi:RHS repeat-associated protein